MPSLALRQLEPELMDDPALDGDAHRQALRGLRRINALSRALPRLAARIDSLTRDRALQSVKIMDIATGSGDIPVGLARFGRRRHLDWHIVATDISERALADARGNAGETSGNITFQQLDIIRQPIPQDIDVIMCSLFFHHLTREACVETLQKMAEAARHAVMVADLRRSTLGYWMAWAGTRVLSRSPVVHFDGPQSVRAAWTIDEMSAIADDAGLQRYRIDRVWPERFIFEWRRS